MFSSKNHKELVRKMSQSTPHYLIKRVSFGVISVLISSTMYVSINNTVFGQMLDTSEKEVTSETIISDTSENEIIESMNTEIPEVDGETTIEVKETENVFEETSLTVIDEEMSIVSEEVTESSTEEFIPVGNDETLKSVDLQIVQDETFGEEARKHVEYLSKEIGSRVVGTQGEARAMQYIIDQLVSYGYTPEIVPFEFTRKEVVYQSNNIVAAKAGNSTKEVILGAHYDSVKSGGSLGADDNASGIGVMLEMAKRLVNTATNYSIKFVAFGAEEMGLRGSRAYANEMTEEEVNNTVGMVNLDSLIAGDKTYIHAGLGGEHWLRDQAFDIAKELNIDDMVPNPGLNPEYPYGETGDWSDHAPFNELGIPVMYFEGTNWDIDDLDGYSQTEEYGPIFHTGMDNLDFIIENYPDRVEHHLHNFSAVLFNTLINMTAPEDKPEPKPEPAPMPKPTPEIDPIDLPNEDVDAIKPSPILEVSPIVLENETKKDEIKDKIFGDETDKKVVQINKSSSMSSLPNTGEAYSSILLGSVFSLLGGILYFFSKRK